MSDIGAAGLARRLALDVALWFAAPALFLWAYVGHFHLAASAIAPHLRYCAVLLLALVLLRAILVLVLPRAYRLLATAALCATLSALLLYYAMVLIGLNSWSRVISWDLIASYLPQMGDLARTLEFAPLALYGALALPPLALGVATWWYLAHRDWVAPALARTPGKLVALCLAAGSAVVALEVANFSHDQSGMASEPFSLTAFPQSGLGGTANVGVNALHAKMFDAEQAQARLAYQPAGGAKRNVVLIVVDALRQENMGVYGYARPTTPFLSRVAEQGMLTRHSGVRASCAESTCGILSISSSRFVHALSKRPFTLHEALQRNGYAVHLILGGDHTNFYGLRDLYGDVDSYYDGFMAKGYFSNDDTLVTARVDQLPRWNGKPTMFHLHLMSVHGLGKRLGGPGPFQPAASYIKRPNDYTPGVGTVQAESRNYYDNGVRQMDGVVETILASLQGKGYLDNALVVLTADHGESLGEHGLHVHANGVHEPLLRIPLLLLSYGAPPPALPGAPLTAAQVDIAPTILETLDLPKPTAWSGMALQGARVAQFTYFQQNHEAGLVDARTPGQVWKYWKNLQSGQEFAFNLSVDPQEMANRISAVPNALKAEWRRNMLQPARPR